VDQIDRAGDVRVDDAPRVVPWLVEESETQAAAGVREQRIDRASLDHVQQLIDAVGGREIDLDRVDPYGSRTEFGGRCVDRALVRRKQHIEPVIDALLREMEADAGRGAGDDGERARRGPHANLLECRIVARARPS
jgi:hypothetical protein